jgi:transcriptional regulator with XRE-family HTH domain
MKTKHPALVRLGENLRRQREERRLTQEQLAEKAEMDPTYISGIERGVRNCSVLSLLRVANALETEAGALLEGAA